jgi:hypothetical protein
MVSQKGALYKYYYCNRGDESFSDKYQGSKTTNAFYFATSVSDSVNGEGIELLAGRCRARTQAQKYNYRWFICTGARTCKRTGHKGKREKGAVGNHASMLQFTTRGCKQKFRVLEDTLMSEKEAR